MVDNKDITFKGLNSSGMIISDQMKSSGGVRADFTSSGQYRPDITERMTVKHLQNQYSGLKGYQRMQDEIRKSLFDEMPELKGRVEILNHTRPLDQEIERIASSLGTDPKIIEDLITYRDSADNVQVATNQAHPKVLEDGRYISISVGPPPGKDAENYTFTDIRNVAWVELHEIFHSLDPLLHPTKSKELYPQYFEDPLQSPIERAAELFADIAARDLLMRNGDTISNSRRRALYLDFSQVLAEPRGLDDPRLIYDYGLSFHSLFEYHDNNEDRLTTFYFTGWKETIERTEEIRGNAQNLTSEAIRRDATQDVILKTTFDHLVDKYAEELRGDEEFWGEPIENLLTSYFANPSYIEYWRSRPYPLEPERIRAMDAGEAIRKEYVNWIENNTQLVPSRKRILFSEEKLRTQDFSASPQESDSTQTQRQLLGEAALNVIQDPDNVLNQKIYNEVFRLFNNQSLMNVVNLEERDNVAIVQETLKKDIIENPLFAQSLADGKGVEECYTNLESDGFEGGFFKYTAVNPSYEFVCTGSALDAEKIALKP